MRISSDEFLIKFKQLFLARTPNIAIFAYWKMKWLIENGECYHLPEYDCYYMIRDKHLLVYYSPDGIIHLTADELNSLDCIGLPAAMYDTIAKQLTGFSSSSAWGLRYNFNYRPHDTEQTQYQAVDFDFNNPQHFAEAARIINGGNDWLDEKNIRKMMKYSAFDPSLWFFVEDKATRQLAAVSISAYDAEVRQTDLDWIYVAPEYQGRGCGRFLLEETIRRCKDKSDDICVGGTVDFYRKCGFVNYEQWVWAPKDGYRFKAEGIQP